MAFPKVDPQIYLQLALYHAFQSLLCATAVNTKFSELFSPKCVYVKYQNAILSYIHPAGDVTRVSVMPRKVTVKIGDAENRCQ